MQKKRVEKTFQAENSKLLRFIHRHLADVDEAEDLLQDVFTTLLSNLNALEAVDNLTAWLYTVTRNKIIDKYRKRKLDTVRLHDDSNTLEIDRLASSIPDSYDELTREWIANEITEALAELPEKQRWVFTENEINGRPFKELAAETGESINTLLARKRYANQFLQKRLKEIKILMEE